MLQFYKAYSTSWIYNDGQDVLWGFESWPLNNFQAPQVKGALLLISPLHQGVKEIPGYRQWKLLRLPKGIHLTGFSLCDFPQGVKMGLA